MKRTLGQILLIFLKNAYACAVGTALLFVFQNESVATEAQRFPSVAIGSPSSNHHVVFIWSHDCPECIDVFQKDIYKYFWRAVEKKDIMFTFLEYEDKDEYVDKYSLPAICGGVQYYDIYTFGYLTGRKTMADIDNLSSEKNVVKLFCQNKFDVRSHLLNEFMLLKKRMPFVSGNKPYLIVDGVVTKSPKDADVLLSR